MLFVASLNPMTTHTTVAAQMDIAAPLSMVFFCGQCDVGPVLW